MNLLDLTDSAMEEPLMTTAENRWHSRQCAYGRTGDSEDECHCPDPVGPDTPRKTCGHTMDTYCTCYLMEFVDPSDYGPFE